MLRQIPIWENGVATGCIDLALERAYIYRPHEDAEVREISAADKEREEEARFAMLETLADHDDKLMEQLLEDVTPHATTVFDDLTSELRDGLIYPVLIGSAENATGILRLLKTIRHDAPNIESTRARLGVDGEAGWLRGVMKRPSTPPTPASCRLPASCQASWATATVIASSATKPVKVSGIHTMLGKDTYQGASRRR